MWALLLSALQVGLVLSWMFWNRPTLPRGARPGALSASEESEPMAQKEEGGELH